MTRALSVDLYYNDFNFEQNFNFVTKIMYTISYSLNSLLTKLYNFFILPRIHILMCMYAFRIRGITIYI